MRLSFNNFSLSSNSLRSLRRLFWGKQSLLHTDKITLGDNHQKLKENLYPQLEILEKERCDAQEKNSFRLRMGGAAMALYVLGLSTVFHSLNYFNGDGFQGFIALIVLPGMAWISYAYAPIYAYCQKFKDLIIPPIFKQYGFAFHSTGGMDINRLKRSKIIPRYDRCRTEDRFSGSYKDVAIEGCEAHLETEHRGNKGRRYYKTRFQGIMIRIQVHKPFNAQTIITRDRGGFFRWFKDQFSDLDTVALEDVDFEKKFDVFSEDQIEARYLLTTAFMDRLLKVGELFGNCPLQASFFDQTLLITLGLGHTDLFEAPHISVPATEISTLAEIDAELQSIFAIVDTLKLDQNIGM